MHVANTIINATQAAIGLTNAAIGIGQAIGQKHKEEEHSETLQLKDDYNSGIKTAIKNKFYGYEYDENGKPIYVGFDNYVTPDGVRLGDLKQQAIEKALGIYWTEEGKKRAIQNIDHEFATIGLTAQQNVESTVNAEEKDLFNQRMTNAIEFATQTGDMTRVHEVLETSNLSPQQQQAKLLEAEREVLYGSALENAVRIAALHDIDESDKYIDELPYLTSDQKSAIKSRVQQRSSQAVTDAVAAATETYSQSIKGGSTIGDAYHAAIANPGGNSTVNEAVKETALRLATQALRDQYGHDMAGAEFKTLQELRSIKRSYENQEWNYQNNGGLYKQHLDEINSYIARAEARESAIANGSISRERANAENEMAIAYMRFNNRELSGPAAIRSIEQLRNASPEKAMDYEAKILGNDRNTAIQGAYAALNDILKSFEPASRASAQEKMEYQQYAHNVREAFFQKYYEGATNEELMKIMDGHRMLMGSSMLSGMFSNGSIGTFGGLGPADRNAAAFAYHSNQGNLDLIYGQRTMDAQMPDVATPLTAGGEKADHVMDQAAERNMAWANKELERKGIQMTGYDFEVDRHGEEDSHGDRTGVIRYTGSDGKTYRVNARSERGSRFIEWLDNGRWRELDVRSLPNVQSSKTFLDRWLSSQTFFIGD